MTATAEIRTAKASTNKLLRWVFVLVPGLLLYLLPVAGFTPAQRHLLAIFIATIIALVVQPVPMGVSTTAAITLLALTKSISPNQIFSGYSNPTVWLLFTAFLFPRPLTSPALGIHAALS